MFILKNILCPKYFISEAISVDWFVKNEFYWTIYSDCDLCWYYFVQLSQHFLVKLYSSTEQPIAASFKWKVIKDFNLLK